MVKRTIRRGLRRLGYEIQKTPPPNPPPAFVQPDARLPAIEPIWPLPARNLSQEAIIARFAQDDLWQYAFEFAGGLNFPARHRNAGSLEDDPKRPIQRFHHVMPALSASQQGSIKGKRVLDIACSSGFWSIQCALMGANVVGFDARAELIDQANFIKEVTGAETAEFRVMDFWNMSPEALGGRFDIVLNLGILYHLPKTLEALALTKQMARDTILLDTLVHASTEALVRIQWEDPTDIRLASVSGVVAFPTRTALELMFRHLQFASWEQIPLPNTDMPLDYLENHRGTWLIKV